MAVELEASESRPVRRALRALWRDLPVWFLAFLGWSTFHLSLKSLDPPHPEFAWTVAFPLAWVIVFVWRVRGEATPRRLIRVAFGVCAPLAVLALLPPRPMTNAQILPWFEGGTLLSVGFLAMHCAVTRGRGDFALFYGVGLLYGLILENGGIAMGFFAEPGYWIHLPGFPGPLATGVGWTSVFYAATHITERLLGPEAQRRPLWQPALMATAIALSLDLQLDAVATAAGWWVWHPSLEPGFLGVPLVNYTAWLAATGPFFALLWWIRGRGWSRARRNGTLLASLAPLLVVELAIVMALTALATGGWDSPAMRIFFAALGGGSR